MQPETLFKLKVQESLKNLPNTWYTKIQQQSIRGTPDLLVCVNGLFIALELKKDDKSQTTRLQDYELGKIRKAGGVAYKVYPENWPQVLGILTEAANLPPGKPIPPLPSPA